MKDKSGQSQGRRKKKKKNKRKHNKHKGWHVLHGLRDRTVIAVKRRITDPKNKDNWKTPFDVYMGKHKDHPAYTTPPLPPAPLPGQKGHGKKATGNSSVISIDVYEASSDSDSD
jgi:hypothetical protein